MQYMVVRSKDAAKEEFSRNLSTALDRQGAPKRGKPEWLRLRLGRIVSRETCRKWLSGKDFPDQAHMTILVDTLNLNEHFLRTGKWQSEPGRDPRLQNLENAWPTLPPGVRNAIMELVSAVNTVRDTEHPPRAVKRRRT